MPAKVTIPVGARFGRLTVLGESPQRKGTFVAWRCRCDCGVSIATTGVNLRGGHTRSCGCLMGDTNRALRLIHGQTNTVEYKSWCSMRGRCLNPNNKKYPSYGGRGIAICSAWDDFAAFYRDMGPKPSPDHTLDRIDNDGPYSAANCRWASPTAQVRNRRNTRRLTWQGQTRSLGEWAEVTGVSCQVISRRLLRGWTAEEALTAPPHARLRPNYITGPSHHWARNR